MNSVFFNGEDFKTKEIFHEIIKDKLNLPSYYGNNLDALNDCLLELSPLPLKVVWNNYSKSKEYLGNYCDIALKVFETASEFLDNKLILEIN
ncbi:Hypopthetical protein [Clostridium bornimense]|uniref:Hypopthetical protein n=1 Tax=Clostridium bornimense TaxID=1216932 RepID=W6RU95_9CLOT|nr:barstar family protein [Clostridium bornimense]CDM68191.1 Hypopthetical protein [Clostridium bornimense]